MSDVQFIPKTCQWIHDNSDKCRLPTLRNKSYCEEHYPQAYKTASDSDVDRIATEELSNIRKTKSWEILDPEE